MTDNVQIDKLLEKLHIVEKMYDEVRIVDPLKNAVIVTRGDQRSKFSMKCFDVWGKGKICNNCISMRAFNENQTFVKIEYTLEKVYMVTAVPAEMDNRRVVFELLKDATESLVFDDGDGLQNSSGIHALIERLNNLALHDSLTGVYNRRYINEKLPVDIVSAYLSNQRLSVIMADIDYFKNVNDVYGHLAGDNVLKAFTETVAGCIKRDSDWLSRYGGEEFLICLPGAGLNKALEIAESMRKSVEEKEIIYGDQQIRITCSFGVLCRIPDENDNAETFVDAADKALYAAKKNGRNRVEASLLI